MRLQRFRCRGEAVGVAIRQFTDPDLHVTEHIHDGLTAFLQIRFIQGADDGKVHVIRRLSLAGRYAIILRHQAPLSLDAALRAYCSACGQ